MRRSSLLWIGLAACERAQTDPDVDRAVEIVSTSPADRATEVPVSASVRVTFTGAIRESALMEGGLTLDPPVDAALRWDGPSLTATLDPTDELAPLTPYVVRLTAAIGLDADTSFTFSTAGPDVVVPPESVVRFGDDVVTVNVDDPAADLRAYTLSTTHALRDNVPADRTRTVAETGDTPRLRSGDLLFDALFQLAVDDARLASVEEIRDGGFNQGGPVPCSCYETGEIWNYVWTRDTSYAVRLGLGWLDPSRARRSLEFKVSAPKAGGPEQIVQDTGSGGSWPVSTDRVVWALAARALVPLLPDGEREAFQARALAALRATAEHDRPRLWDTTDGLYRGEQSFLDWREQTYPRWTQSNVTSIATSKALSTNALHHVLLETLAAWSAEAGEPDAALWQARADELAAAMRAGFWPNGDDHLASFRLSAFDPAPSGQTELLGVALTALQGVLSPEAAGATLAAYPHTAFGPPVIWPQQPATAIYHNRAIWPFVTSFDLLAAKHVDNPALFHADLHSLVRGAALNLSNMENLEFLTGRNWVNAGAESGPVVNSRRQLWSFAGYLGAVIEGVFGVQADGDTLRLAPYITPEVHRERLGGGPRASLEALRWRGREISVSVELPAVGADGGRAYTPAQVWVDGEEVPLDANGGAALNVSRILNNTHITIRMADPAQPSAATWTQIEDNGDHRRIWAPEIPGTPTLTRVGDDLQLAWSGPDGGDVTWEVWRDGVRIADSLPTPTWTDTPGLDAQARCYTVAAVYPTTGLRSQHAPAACWWGDDTARITDLGPRSLSQPSGDARWSDQYGRAHYMDWGDPGDALTVEAFRAEHSGDHLLQVVYGNGAGPINTGITCATKWLTVEDAASGDVVAEGMVAMPQLATWDAWTESTPLRARLEAGTVYRLHLSDDMNMSYFAHFSTYTGGLGGGGGTFNRANVHAIRALAIDGVTSPPSPRLLTLEGDADLDRFPVDRRVVPPELGLPLEPWEATAIAWDDRRLYGAQVSRAFEDDFAPWVVYLEADPTGDAIPSDGLLYQRGPVNTAARVPFQATHAIAVRALPGAGPDGGPWPGLWRREPGGWRLIRRFELGRDLFLAADRHTLSFELDLAWLGEPATVRAASHVLWGVAGDEWKDTWPAEHTPWDAGGGAFETLSLR